jgi:methylase of polypeptide subunit release factors
VTQPLQEIQRRAEAAARAAGLKAPRGARAGAVAALACALPEGALPAEAAALAPALWAARAALGGSPRAALEDALGGWRAPAEAPFEALGRLHERLRAGARQRAGIFYTPRPLARWLGEAALEGLAPEGARLRAADPSCGCGALLAALGEALLARDAAALEGLYGMDTDPVAVELARLHLYALARDRGLASGALIERLGAQLRVADGLRARLEGLDLVISNPPFGNAIERATGRSARAQERHRGLLPQVAQGAYDLSVLFAVRAAMRLRPGGRYGLILPRSVLSVDSARGAREALWAEAPPELLWSPPGSRHFPGADVFLALVVGRRGGEASTVLVSDAAPDAGGAPQALRAVTPARGEPWAALLSPSRALLRQVEARLLTDGTVGDHLQIHGGAATGVAYELRGLVRDAAEGEGARLITTGLIDRYRVHWGERACRFLGRDYEAPRWPREGSAEGSAALWRALARQRAPKVLVGGLSRVLEAVADPDGGMAGVVSTWVLLAPPSTPRAVWLLEGLLNAAPLSLLYMGRFWGKQIGGDNATIGRRELKTLPLPAGVGALLRDPGALAPRGEAALTEAEVFAGDPRDPALAPRLARQVIGALQRPAGVAVGLAAQALVEACVARLYGLDAQTHAAAQDWAAGRQRRR